MAKINKIFFYPTSWALILANTVPLLGVLFWNWDVFSVIILYWMESAVIGFFNFLKMQKINNNKFTPLVPFFVSHYVIFMSVHLFFVVNFFRPDIAPASGQVEAFVNVFSYFKTLFISLSLIFLSHGASFVYNFIQKEEFKKTTLRKQMFSPYKRIIIMHFVIILAAARIVYLDYGQEVSAVVFLVVLKIIFDLFSHIIEHRKNIFN